MWYKQCLRTLAGLTQWSLTISGAVASVVLVLLAAEEVPASLPADGARWLREGWPILAVVYAAGASIVLAWHGIPVYQARRRQQRLDIAAAEAARLQVAVEAAMARLYRPRDVIC